MWIVVDRTDGQYRKGDGWVAEKAEADRFTESLARRLASVFSAALGHDVGVEAEAS